MPPLVVGGALTTAGAAVIGSGLTAATGLGAGVIQSRGNNRAIAAQERARQEALAYERERESNARNREDQARNQYRQDYAEWLERNYGVRRMIGGGTTGSNNAPMPGASPAAGLPAAPAAGAIVPGALATPPAVPGVPPLAGAGNQQGQTLADLGGWQDWRRYGVGG